MAKSYTEQAIGQEASSLIQQAKAERATCTQSWNKARHERLTAYIEGITALCDALGISASKKG